jgi:hypothetical protein
MAGVDGTPVLCHTRGLLPRPPFGGTGWLTTGLNSGRIDAAHLPQMGDSGLERGSIRGAIHGPLSDEGVSQCFARSSPRRLSGQPQAEASESGTRRCEVCAGVRARFESRCPWGAEPPPVVWRAVRLTAARTPLTGRRHLGSWHLQPAVEALEWGGLDTFSD